MAIWRSEYKITGEDSTGGAGVPSVSASGWRVNTVILTDHRCMEEVIMASFTQKLVGATVALELMDIYDDLVDHEAGLEFLCAALGAIAASGDSPMFSGPESDALILYVQQARNQATTLSERMDKLRRLIHPVDSSGGTNA